MFSIKIIIRALICCILALIPNPELENQIYDAQVQLSAKTKINAINDIVILEVTKDDFETLKEKYDHRAQMRENNQGTWFEKFDSLRDQFFWNDAIYENLLRKILAENPKSLIVGFFFPENIVNLQNRPDLQKLTRNPKVIWASHFDADQKFIKPASELVGTENYGFTNLFPDPDGVIRKANLIQNNHASLPFRALLNESLILKQNKPLTSTFLINYSGVAETFRTCRITENCESLKDKHVILAPAGNALSTGEIFRTPVGKMTRAEIIANILLTAKKNNSIQTVSYYWLFLMLFAHVLAFGYTVLYYRTAKQIKMGASLLAFEFILSLVLIRFFSYHLMILPFLSTTIITYVGFLWIKFSNQEIKRWEAVKRAQYLSELDEMKSNFISLMSHDLKTPIAKVQALTERLAREAQSLNLEQKDILESIRKSNEELAQFILNILDFQKIESSAMKLNSKSNDINQLIEETITRLMPLAQEKKIQLNTNLEPLFSAEFDEKLIRQVLNNLIENAIKYNPEGTEVTISSKEEGEFLLVRVQDNGKGIAPDDQPRLFKKFSRTTKALAERVKGTGLGLYLAKYFIELHGGKISVETEVGKGTSFYFYLPISSNK